MDRMTPRNIEPKPSRFQRIQEAAAVAACIGGLLLTFIAGAGFAIYLLACAFDPSLCAALFR